MSEKIIIKHDIVIPITTNVGVVELLDRYAQEGKEVVNVQCMGSNPDAQVPMKFMIVLRWTEAR